MKKLLLAIPIIAAFIAVPQVAHSQQIATETTQSTAVCEISDAQLNWGTLERWRSYISGSIAKGSWDLEGTKYEIPEFVWESGVGSIAPGGKGGQLQFAGSVDFSGHDDLLQVTVANPLIDIAGDKALMMLDLSSTTPTGDEDINVTGALAVEFDLKGVTQISENTFQITAAPGVLTDAGAAAFGGFYEGGETADPLTITATTSVDCSLAASGESGGVVNLLPTAAWITIGVVAVVLAGGLGAVVARRGNKK